MLISQTTDQSKIKPEFHKHSRQIAAGIVLLLITANCIAFMGGVNGKFLLTWDDATYILHNPLLASLSSTSIPPLFTNFYFGNYAPLHLLSYLADLKLWGENPSGFHLVNLFLHTLNSLLLFALLTRYGLTIVAAAAGTVIFSIHPVQVETVVWISERKNILTLLFMLLSMHCWISWDSAAKTEKRTECYYWLALLLFLMSLLSKSAAVIFPLILIGHHFCRHGLTKVREATLRLAPFLTLSVLFSYIAMKSQTVENAGGRLSEHHGNWLFTMPPVFARYLTNLLWPSELLPAYSPGYRVTADTTVIISVAILSLFFAALFFIIKKERSTLFWIICILAPMLPVSHIIPFSSLMNDRYLYIPMIGIAGLTATAVDRTIMVRGKIFRSSAAVFGVMLLIVLLHLSNRQTAIWQDDVTLWSYVIEKSPPNHVFYWRLGDSQRLSGNPQASIPSYFTSLKLKAENPKAEIGLAEALLDTGQPAAAIPYALSVIRLTPRYHHSFTILGESYLLLGEKNKAESALSRAVQLAPTDNRPAAALNRLRTLDMPNAPSSKHN